MQVELYDHFKKKSHGMVDLDIHTPYNVFHAFDVATNKSGTMIGWLDTDGKYHSEWVDEDIDAPAFLQAKGSDKEPLKVRQLGTNNTSHNNALAEANNAVR